MRINANVMAVNTHRQLYISTTNGAKSMEKLSSGYRINRAADDAAGLAISEKMRSQIRGMKQASRNAQDGISVVQTAEGALDEIHSMLQRMKELSVQSANDSNQSLVDREALQLEVDQLTEEINSITTKTQFNKMRLLDGTFDGKKFHVGANQDETIGVSIRSMTASGLGLSIGGKQEIFSTGGKSDTIHATGSRPITTAAASIATGGKLKLADFKVEADASGNPNAGKTAKFQLVVNGKREIVEMAVTDGKFTATAASKFIKEQLTAKFGDLFSLQANKVTIQLKTGLKAQNAHIGANVKIEMMNEGDFGIADIAAADISASDAVYGAATAATAEVSQEKEWQRYEVELNGKTVSFEVSKEELTKADGSYKDQADIVALLKSKLGELADAIDVDYDPADNERIVSFTTKAKGENANILVRVFGEDARKNVDYKGVNILTREAANKSINNVQSAIENLASRRAELGAIQNRLEHTIKNLDNSHENLVASESRVRHVDMALEIIEQTRNSILQQAATSMLAQANQAPQTVLSLLR